MFGASGETLAYAKEYLYVLCWGIPFYLVATMLVSVVRADGDPRYSMIATCTGCIVNIILDPVFIYGFDMRMTGAALATVIGQLSCFVFMMVHIPKYKTFHLNLKALVPDVKEVVVASQFGVSSFLTNISTVTLSIVTNELLQILVGDVLAGIPQLVDDAVLDVCLRIDRLNRLAEPCQIVRVDDENVLQTPVLA